jgi:hypothetical protein
MKRIALLTVLLLIGSLGTIAKADTVVYSTGTDLTIAPTTDTSFFLSTNLAGFVRYHWTLSKRQEHVHRCELHA